MASLVPNRFLFKFELTLHRCRKAPALKGRVADWNDRWRLPALHVIDGEDGFGDVYVTWDENGLYIGCEVGGRTRPPHCDPTDFWKSDNLRIMTDMRDTRQIRRGTRFCQHFYLLANGGGRSGRDAIAGSAPVNRATESAGVYAPGEIPIASHVTQTGYSLTAHLPAACLHGFDPTENPRIGFFYMLEDGELGQQSLTVGDDLNWWVDPSTWPTAILTE
ncbi:MAG: hypothetical protein O7D94_12330 [Planctomycetota bacterium]|nr:hypothetical protein [Planctomycetota bacterium]